MILKKRFVVKIRGWLAFLYFSFLAYLVFFAPRRRNRVIRSINPVPLKSTLNDYRVFHDYYPLKFWIDFLGNILIFIPVCVIVKFLVPRTRFIQVLFFGFLLSLSIEVMQYVFEVGYSEIDDLILNTLGTGIGIVLYKLLSRIPVISD